MTTLRISTVIQVLILLSELHQSRSSEDGYLRFVKDGCFIRREALSCVKYKALKLAKNTIFGDDLYNNVTIKANNAFSFVPLDEDTIKNITKYEDKDVVGSEPRGILSEWSELAKYFMKLVKDFFKMKGLRVNLPEGARTIEDQETDDDGRGKKKRLAILVPLLTLLAAVKTKLLLIPVLLAVLLIKKLLLIAALLLPSLLSTLKHCKHHHPIHHSYFGSSDSSDFTSDYGNNYAYSSGGGYAKDWASNRAYTMPKHRPTPASSVYITAPGSSV